jgi:hypothetical protein
MDSTLQRFLRLNGKISKIDSDSFIYSLEVTNENISILKELDESNIIEEIKDSQDKIIPIENISTLLNRQVYIEFVTSDLKKIGFYLTLKDFIINNRFEVPIDFYISELSYSNATKTANEYIEKYKTITKLISRLITKSKFISEEHNKTLYLVQDNSFVEIPIEDIVYEEFLEDKTIKLINQYVEDIDSYKEKRTIYLKELIDFLTNKNKNERFNNLIKCFDEFYERCNTSFEFYLSNFSFNKVKLELDNSVLEYSKNIRSIINDSQSKLIAIPAAFILGVTQIDYSNPLLLKNILIISSAFLFSYIISVFIKNQMNAIEIIADNLSSYKINYKRSKSTVFEEEKDLDNLSRLINKSYEKIDFELIEQKKRLNILQICNWGISAVILISILITSFKINFNYVKMMYYIVIRLLSFFDFFWFAQTSASL